MSQGSNTMGRDPTMPIAIIGLSGRYPGDASSPEKLWDMICEARSAMTEVPKDRFNIDSFYHPHNERAGALNVRGGHYMNHTAPDAFDAPFFSITPNEAKAMDPQQRMALECAFEAMENAGVRMEDVAGSETSCYVGSFSKDYSELLAADQEDLPLYFGVGTGTAILSNRISWFFDLKGPSISIDTACSSALVALHLGCQSIRTGESTMSIVGGVNFMLVPGVMTAMSALHFLSPDSICHSFDEAANGYARGEGSSFVVLKPLDQALKDGDVIRGVVRATGVNQDGNTPGITVPSAASQEALIRKCYRDAGLDFAETDFVEAHGTGTQAGDPQEASALAATFGASRPAGDPVRVGSIKTNIGHLEGASGLAQVTKAIFALEKGVIPPNLWFNKPNPRIPMEDWNIKVVDQMTPWPTTGQRRISINSFGYGGTNAHAVIDDAYHYLSSRGLIGNHNTNTVQARLSRASSTDDSALGSSDDDDNVNLDSRGGWQDTVQHLASHRRTPTKLLIWSSNEQSGVQRTSNMYQQYLSQKLEDGTASQQDDLMDKFTRTLGLRRAQHPWRSYAVVSSAKEACEALAAPSVKPKRAKKAGKIGFIFTGQGAQWFAMGRELLAYKTFKQSLEEADECLTTIGAHWSLLEELVKPEASSRINQPEFSQPICTAVQIALVDLLEEWGISPSAVSGHSSGEIGAAYAKGAVTRENAWQIAYHRGRLAAALPELAPNLKGAMLATGLGAEAVQPYIARVQSGTVQVACKNSPTSTTISGDESAIEELEQMLKSEQLFARRLIVSTAYHSLHMQSIASAYLRAISGLKPEKKAKKGVLMFSSVTGNIIEAKDLTADYWVQNMVQPVDFVGAIQQMVRYSKTSRKAAKPYVDAFLELGPSAALKGPLRQILKEEGSKAAELSYSSVLERGKNACTTALSVAGDFFQQGYTVNMAAINKDQSSLGQNGHLVDIPPFAWNRNNKYWAESQVSKNYRFRDHPRTDLLGAALPQMNSIEPIFRTVMKVAEMPWVECHQVQGTILYPAAGMLVMAVEAAARIADKTKVVEGYEVQDAIIGKAIVIKPDDVGTETMISLRPWRHASRDLESSWDEFRIFSRKDSTWELNCSGLVRAKYKTSHNSVFADEEKITEASLRERFQKIEAGCHRSVEAETHYENLATIGLGFSGPFKSICSVNRGDYKSRCDISIPDTKSLMPHEFEYPHVIHPSTLDCVIQVGLAGATPAEKELMVPLIPTSIGRLFVSAGISSEPGKILHGAAAIENEGFDDAQGSFIVFDEDWQKPVVTIENVRSTALRHGELGLQQAAQIRKLASYLEWKEDVDKLDNTELAKICAAATEGLKPVTKQTVTDLEHAAFIYMKRVLSECSASEAKTFAPHFQKFYQLMQKTFHEVIDGSNPHQNRGKSWLSCTQAEEEELLSRVAKDTADGAALCQHGNSLPAIMRDEVKGIEVLMQNDLLNNFYQYGQGNDQVYAQLAAYVDVLGHKKPDMKILEIGAGTGGATLPVLQTLGGRNGSAPRFSEYTFTDISTGFFDKAHQKFKSWLPHMKFAKFDITEDPTTQGLKFGDYDLIVAANVLHATPSMDATMSSVRKLLKPDGKLVMSEITNPLLRIHMIVGCFDGWWAGAADGREWGPTMTEATWDQVLKRNNFTGLDVVLRDIDDEEDHFYTLLVSSASKSLAATLPPALTIIKPTEASSDVTPFWLGIEQALRSQNAQVNVLTLDEAKETDLSSTPTIFAIDCEEKCLLPEISEADFETLKKVIFEVPYSVYLTRGATLASETPTANMIAGLARCIRAENPTVSFTTLDLDGSESKISESNVNLALKTVASAAHSIDAARPDWELAARGGKLFVPRILLDDGVNELLSSTLIDPKPEEANFVQQGRALELKIGNPGRLDTLHFVDDDEHSSPLDDSQVEIQVKAMGLNFKDIMIAMGQIQENALGLDCSGVVTRVGANVNHVSPGDRVLTWGPGSFRNYFRTPAAMAFRIPDELDFGAAASLPLAYSTAYYAIFESAKLQKGESILIHGGAGAVGQAAINLANHLGAEVFATVSSDSKKQLLINHLGVAEDHIFNSRDLSFADGIMRLTEKRGVDVVLNSLAGEALQKTWQCISYFGRFIEMGMKDIERNSRLDMAPFARNVTFSAINLTTVLKHDLKKCSTVLGKVLELVHDGIARPIEPVTRMPLSQIEEGFRTMQLGRHTGKIVFEVGDNDMVMARPAPVKPVRFDSNATYLLAGGLGGLGRSIAQWMVRGGAKHFVFLSRSGAKKAEAQETIKALEDDGAHVAAFACDIADESSLRGALEKCKDDFPPIRGLLQCAMVLNDVLYENMTHEEYMRATSPKVQGSWNLHELLPKDLDFFVLLSSSAGVAGSRGQGNYAAGNTYQDALANYRQTKGLHATSIDLGMILNVGYVAETTNQEVADNTKKWSFAGIREEELHLIIQCGITSTSLGGNKVPPQLITGLGTGGMAKLAGYDIPWWFNDAKFAHIKNVDTSRVQGDTAEDTEETLALIAEATSMENAADMVQIALMRKLSKSLMVDIEDIDSAKPISRHGVDSLLAVEVRAWLVTDLKADISVFQLLSNVPISELVKDIAAKSKLVPAAVSAAAAT